MQKYILVTHILDSEKKNIILDVQGNGSPAEGCNYYDFIVLFQDWREIKFCSALTMLNCMCALKLGLLK